METETVIRSVVTAYSTGDFDAVSALLADDLRYRINADAATGPYHADCDCKADFFEAVQVILDEWNVVSYTLADLIVSGDRGAAQIAIEMKSRHRTDHIYEGRLALFFRIACGQVAELVEYHDTAAAGMARG